MKKNSIKQIIVDFHKEPLPNVIERNVKIPIGSNKIISLIGVRRAGKTFTLIQIMHQLLKKNIKKNKIIYINFEDERLDLKADELELIIQAYAELYPNNNFKECYIFFDEIQVVENWEKFVRRIYDTLTKNIFITGSNSKLLSREIATSLRGRTLSYEIFPLDFKEFLKFKNVKPDFYHTTTKAKIVNLFYEYLTYGGFPEIIFLDNKELKIKTLQNYFEVMLYKDLVERYEIKQITLLKFFLKRLFEQITSPVSINKIYNDVKSQGYKISKDRLYEFAEYIENIYIGLFSKKYSISILKTEFSAKKFYTIDNGLLNAVTFKYSQDYGKLFENLVFMELKKAGKDVFYYKNRKECDFLYFENNTPLLVQACFDTSEKNTLNREIESLKSIMEFFNIKKGYIVTGDTENIIKNKNFEIELIPFYRFCFDVI